MLLRPGADGPMLLHTTAGRKVRRHMGHADHRPRPLSIGGIGSLGTALKLLQMPGTLRHQGVGPVLHQLEQRLLRVQQDAVGIDFAHDIHLPPHSMPPPGKNIAFLRSRSTRGKKSGPGEYIN